MNLLDQLRQNHGLYNNITSTTNTNDNNNSTKNNERMKDAYDIKVELSKDQLSSLKKIQSLVDRDSQKEEYLKEWLDEACYVRYLRANNWDLSATKLALLNSLEWRKSYRPHEITAEQVQGVCSLGSMYLNGFDLKGNPIVYVRPGPFNPFSADQRVRALVFLLEYAINNRMDKYSDVSRMTWLIDFGDFANRAKSPDSTTVMRNSLSILQNQYPERLAFCLIINAPWFMNLAYTLISPFIDSTTRQKIHWVNSKTKEDLASQLATWIHPEQLEERYGGQNSWVPSNSVEEPPQPPTEEID